MADFQENKSDAVEGADARLRQQTQAARRRILLGSAGVAPVIMSVASPSLAACTTVFTPSMATSANLSGKNTPVTSNGRNPAYWANPSNSAAWPASYTSGQTFVSVFLTAPVGGSSTTTLLQALSGTDLFARACVASLLNAETGKYVPTSSGNWLTADTVKAMWTGGNGSGWTVPGTSVTWTKTQIQNYLVNTWVTDACVGP